VATGGRIRIGDRVELVEADLDPPIPGGWITGLPYQLAGETQPARS
jgi:hypothetical protein